ncbi:hypothetical protein Taro_007872 [Colocasia esculenta]|uniref:Uncharacterized protein n=1 Tax=Colocasia esculenta TaxID=4460 RepID=A0A843U589_COLES|nr:hypothetical protein [Colocasia esculenta]
MIPFPFGLPSRRTVELRGKRWFGDGVESFAELSWLGLGHRGWLEFYPVQASQSFSHCLAHCGSGTDVYHSPSGSLDPWAATAKIGSSSWAEGRVLESLQLDMASRRRRQARELIEQKDEFEMPVQVQVHEEGAHAVAAAGGQQQQEYQPQPQLFADWFPLAEQFFRAMYQGAWQTGLAATGGQFSVPPPAVPEQRAESEVE